MVEIAIDVRLIETREAVGQLEPVEIVPDGKISREGAVGEKAIKPHERHIEAGVADAALTLSDVARDLAARHATMRIPVRAVDVEQRNIGADLEALIGDTLLGQHIVERASAHDVERRRRADVVPRPVGAAPDREGDLVLMRVGLGRDKVADRLMEAVGDEGQGAGDIGHDGRRTSRVEVRGDDPIIPWRSKS